VEALKNWNHTAKARACRQLVVFPMTYLIATAPTDLDEIPNLKSQISNLKSQISKYKNEFKVQVQIQVLNKE